MVQRTRTITRTKRGGCPASVIASIGGNDRVIAVSKEMLNEEDLTQGKQGHKLKLFSKRTTLSVTGSDSLTGGILQRTLCERGQGRAFFRKAAPLSPGTGGLLEKTACPRTRGAGTINTIS